MPITSLQTPSAITVTITFDDIEIGELQNFSAMETYNIAEVYGVGSPIPDFVPGLFKGSISARRAFFDANIIFTKLVPMAEGDPNLKVSSLSQLRTVINLQGNFVKSAGHSLNDLLSNFISIAGTTTLLNQPIIKTRMTQKIMFDVKVYNNYVTADKLKVRDLIAIYQDCIIDSRKMTIDSGNIIIAEEISMKFRSKL